MSLSRSGANCAATVSKKPKEQLQHQDKHIDAAKLKKSPIRNAPPDDSSSSSSNKAPDLWISPTSPPLMHDIGPVYPSVRGDEYSVSVEETITNSRRTRGTTVSPFLREYLEFNLQRWQPTFSQHADGLEGEHPYQAEYTNQDSRGVFLMFNWFKAPPVAEVAMAANANPACAPITAPCLTGTYIIPNTSVSILESEARNTASPGPAGTIPSIILQQPRVRHLMSLTPYAYPVFQNSPSEPPHEDTTMCTASWWTACQL